jgi:hypothetical protein
VFNPLTEYMLESPLAAIPTVSVSGQVSKSFAHLDCTIFVYSSFDNSSSSDKLVVDHY